MEKSLTSGDLKVKVLSALKVVCEARLFDRSLMASPVVFSIYEMGLSGSRQFNVVAELRYNYRNGLADYKHWFINCDDAEIVTVDTLKRFLVSLRHFSEHNIRKIFITSRYPFNRGAVRYAFEKRIGLARVSPAAANKKPDTGSDLILGIGPLELKKALCNNEFGIRRKSFYGFTSRGKIEHFGSLENYFRREMFNIIP
ncbi:hypothetical protein [Phosphitispora fastidiosa]|uniref:hypothetical protein n=1 Tax=Phosphitispora fastidiosa TaxID=2837202 RepID=UPI001E60C879|nr:hypothetical protein [Phosphitispora fastidiosa]MBU7005383.1 hypothetical protein [Phosphitispora fastidiosa]